jgi:Spy/CpxP family protein refolding chaperone
LVLVLAANTVRAQQPSPANPPPKAPPAPDAKLPAAPENPLEGWLQGLGRLTSGDLGPYSFLNLEQVQKDLKLTQEQKDKLKAINDEFHAKRRQRIEALAGAATGDRAARPAELRAKAREDRAEYRKKIEAVLLPEQRNRLGQIALQLRGPLSVLADEKMAKTLKLNPDQQKQIQAIEKALGDRLDSALQDLRGRRSASQAELEAKAAELRDQAVQQALGVLTPEQKDSLEKMKGERLLIERPRLRPFRRLLSFPPDIMPPTNPPPPGKPNPPEK